MTVSHSEEEIRHAARQVLERVEIVDFPDTVELQPVRQGFSGSRVFRVADTQGRLYCLKRWNPQRTNVDRLSWIHRFHVAIEHLPFVAKLTRFDSGQTCIEGNAAVWELSTWLNGAADFNLQPTRTRFAAVVSAVMALHDALRENGGTVIGKSQAVASRYQLCTSLNTRLRQADLLLNVAERESAIERRGLFTGGVEFVDAMPAIEVHRLAWQAIGQLQPWLVRESQLIRHTAGTLQPVLRDLWHDNVLLAKVEVSGIVDFGELQFDLVECDWARLLGSLKMPAHSIWEMAREEIGSLARGLDLNWRLMHWLHAATTIGGWLNWLDWLYGERRTLADPLAARARHAALAKQILTLEPH
jgi:hypothetical protein